MEEANHRRKPPLTVQREFAGSRLEEQILSRLYELAVPVLLRRTATAQTPKDRALDANDNRYIKQIAQGG
jgi:hypothetical protein